MKSETKNIFQIRLAHLMFREFFRLKLKVVRKLDDECIQTNKIFFRWQQIVTQLLHMATNKYKKLREYSWANFKQNVKVKYFAAHNAHKINWSIERVILFRVSFPLWKKTLFSGCIGTHGALKTEEQTLLRNICVQ